MHACDVLHTSPVQHCVCVCFVCMLKSSVHVCRVMYCLLTALLQYNWIANVRTLLNTTAAITVDGSEPVVVTSLKYFLNLTQIINSMEPS